MKKTTICSIAALIAFATPTSFAQDKGKPEATKAKTETTDKEKKKPADKFDVEIKLEGNDAMEFDKNTFSVKSGQRVKLTLKNVGKLEKGVMGHNVVLLKKGTDLTQFAIAAMGSVADGYIPQDKKVKAKIISHTKLLGPGETDSFTFTAPAAGKYDYVCTFPGHFAKMKGVMTVKPADKKEGSKKETTTKVKKAVK